VQVFFGMLEIILLLLTLLMGLVGILEIGVGDSLSLVMLFIEMQLTILRGKQILIIDYLGIQNLDI
jgi:hypothetical protein